MNSLASKKGAASKDDGSHRYQRRMGNREIGLLMIILAAQTLSDISTLQMLSTEHAIITDPQYYMNRPSMREGYFSFSMPSFMSLDKLHPDSLEGMSSSTTDSENDGQCEHATDDEEEEQVQAVPPQAAAKVVPVKSTDLQQFVKDESVWENILDFLPWRSVAVVRGVSRFHLFASLPYVTVARLPHTKVPAIFIPCRDPLPEKADPAIEYIPGGGEQQHDGQRMFFGQLRRDSTVSMVQWLVNYVFDAPKGALKSIENHRNPYTGRGKGCAWPTIKDDATVQRLLNADHRLFYDSIQGVEGVWIIPPAAKGALEDEVAQRRAPHLKYMPRSSIVVELPSSRPAQARSAAPAYHQNHHHHQSHEMMQYHNFEPHMDAYCPANPPPYYFPETDPAAAYQDYSTGDGYQYDSSAAYASPYQWWNSAPRTYELESPTPTERHYVNESGRHVFTHNPYAPVVFSE